MSDFLEGEPQLSEPETLALRFSKMSPGAREELRRILGELIEWDEDDNPNPANYPHLTRFRQSGLANQLQAEAHEELAVQRAREILEKEE